MNEDGRSDLRRTGATSRWHFLVLFVLIAAVLVLMRPSPASAHYIFADDGCGPGGSGDNLFYAGGDEWTIFTNAGYDGCHMVTLTSTDTLIDFLSDDWAEWYLPIDSTNYNHYYDIWTWLDNRTAGEARPA